MRWAHSLLRSLGEPIMLHRRALLSGLPAAALGLLGLAGCAAPKSLAKARVLVVGGGYGGATAAKYLRLLSGHTLDVVLVEPDAGLRLVPDVEPRRSAAAAGSTRSPCPTTAWRERTACAW